MLLTLIFIMVIVIFNLILFSNGVTPKELDQLPWMNLIEEMVQWYVVNLI